MKNLEIVESIWMTPTAGMLLSAYEGWVKDGRKHVAMGRQSYFLVIRSPMVRKLERLGLVDMIGFMSGDWPVLTRRGRVITRLLLHRLVREDPSFRKECVRDFGVWVWLRDGEIMMGDRPTCPRCGWFVDRDEVDVGVGVMYGPHGCSCGWSESREYDVTAGPSFTPEGGRIDSRGGVTPE